MGLRPPLLLALALGCETLSGCGSKPEPTTPQADLTVPNIPPVRKDDPNGRGHVPPKPVGKKS